MNSLEVLRLRVEDRNFKFYLFLLAYQEAPRWKMRLIMDEGGK
jgi:hypothetical protein